jgi:hypothetical protein
MNVIAIKDQNKFKKVFKTKVNSFKCQHPSTPGILPKGCKKGCYTITKRRRWSSKIMRLISWKGISVVEKIWLPSSNN